MSDPGPQGWLAQNIVPIVSGVTTLVVGSLEYLRRRIDILFAKQASFVTREELEKILLITTESNERKHGQNLNSIDRLTQRIDRVLERL